MTVLFINAQSSSHCADDFSLIASNAAADEGCISMSLQDGGSGRFKRLPRGPSTLLAVRIFCLHGKQIIAFQTPGQFQTF